MFQGLCRARDERYDDESSLCQPIKWKIGNGENMKLNCDLDRAELSRIDIKEQNKTIFLIYLGSTMIVFFVLDCTTGLPQPRNRRK